MTTAMPVTKLPERGVIEQILGRLLLFVGRRQMRCLADYRGDTGLFGITPGVIANDQSHTWY
jgi:hypothetical protein